MDKALLAILVCPVCKGNLHYDQSQQELICTTEGLAYPIQDEIPVMLVEEARTMSFSEVESLKNP